MTSAAAQAMNGLVAAIHPGLKDLRYRKRRNTFNRVMHPDGLIHVINFQMGPFDPPGTAEIPGLRPNLYGRFTINLGVWLPGLTEQGSTAPAQHSTCFINDYNCHLRARIGELLPEAADTWWRLSAPADQLAAIVSSAITGHALPWLARFSTWDDTLRQLEAAPADPNWFMSPPRLTAMRMRLARGEHADAERDFAEHMDAWMKNPRNPSHLEFLAEIAAQHSFKVEVAAATAGAPRQLHALRERDAGALLSLVQKHAGVSQARLTTATGIGIGQGRLNEIVNGHRQVARLDVLERIADGLAMPDDARVLFGLAPVHADTLTGHAEISQV